VKLAVKILYFGHKSTTPGCETVTAALCVHVVNSTLEGFHRRETALMCAYACLQMSSHQITSWQLVLTSLWRPFHGIRTPRSTCNSGGCITYV